VLFRSQQANAERKAEMQEQNALAKQQLMLQIEKLAAEIGKLRADASRLQAETVGKGVDAMKAATEAGQIVATIPAVAPVADELLKSAGFEDQNQPPLVPTPAAAPIQHLTSPVPGGLPNG